ncbi:MAG: TlpA family protein disulfide reductase [Betaproteobacteria bacterium]|nr:TlpA family protein disulfide reductase [Betaproteobacteria bacterium]
MKRRTLLMAGAGTAAAGAGVGWQLWRAPAGAGGPPLAEAELGFWQSSFTQPDGQTLALAPLLGQPLVLNFWATWCPPCVKEMPELDRFAKTFAARGGRVVGLAVDNPTAVRQYLAKAPVGYAIGLAGFDGTQLSRNLGNSTGALPFTALFDRRGAVVQRKLGETSFDELIAWAQKL